MKYFVLLAGYGEMPGWDEQTEEEQAEGMAKHEAFDVACADRPGGEILSAEQLGDGSMATTLRARGGETTVTDGSFAEAAEQIGGYCLLEAPDLDTVVELCRILPAYDIELRPVLELSGRRRRGNLLPLLILAVLLIRTYLRRRLAVEQPAVPAAVTTAIVVALLVGAAMALFVHPDPREYETATVSGGTTDVVSGWEGLTMIVLSATAVAVGWRLAEPSSRSAPIDWGRNAP